MIDGKPAVSRNIIASCQSFHVNFISSSALISAELLSLCVGISGSLMVDRWVMACALMELHYNTDSFIAFSSDEELSEPPPHFKGATLRAE